MKGNKTKAKFRVGQVVRHHVAGAFYARILRPHQINGEAAWYVIEQGKITTYWDWQLRPLTKRERGPNG